MKLTVCRVECQTSVTWNLEDDNESILGDDLRTNDTY